LTAFSGGISFKIIAFPAVQNEGKSPFGKIDGFENLLTLSLRV
jgi:hypothetical protein